MVCHFRAADAAVGGQGASLAPMFHPTLVRRLGFQPPIWVLNVGVVTKLIFYRR
jgi:1,6-anhydro-N-acetylmuramate kinase